MDRINVFFDYFFDWHIALACFLGIWSEKLHNRWKNRDKNPYKWECVDCIEQGTGFFKCSANTPDACDRMIIAHKTATHGG